MKLTDIFYNYITEQFEPTDGIDNPFDDNTEDNNNNQFSRQNKPLSHNQMIKKKWLESQPYLDQNDMNNIIEIFNRKKNVLKPFSGKTGSDGVIRPTPGNSPEVVALKMRFPNLSFLSDGSKIKDALNYSWKEIQFLLETFNEIEERQVLDLNLHGDTPEERYDSAMKKWTHFPFRDQVVVNSDGLIVIKCESVEESISLGELQYLTKTKCENQYSHNRWCTTKPMSEGGNLYSSYRNEGRSFYYVMDTNRDTCDDYYLGAIQPMKTGGYKITKRRNLAGTEITTNKWSDIVAIWPGLRGKEHIITYFPLTEKELGTKKLDNYNTRFGDRRDIAVQPNNVKMEYVSTGRNVNSARVFNSFPENVRKTYISATNINNYKTRYLNDDPNSPFGMIEALTKQEKGTLHNFILKTQLNVRNGIFDIYRIIIATQLKRSFYDSNNDNIRFFENNLRPGKFGVMDISNLTILKEFEYKFESTKLIKYKNEPRYINKYVDTNGDYFYWLLKLTTLTQSSNDFLKANYLSDEEGDELLREYERNKSQSPSTGGTNPYKKSPPTWRSY